METEEIRIPVLCVYGLDIDLILTKYGDDNHYIDYLKIHSQCADKTFSTEIRANYANKILDDLIKGAQEAKELLKAYKIDTDRV